MGAIIGLVSGYGLSNIIGMQHYVLDDFAYVSPKS